MFRHFLVISLFLLLIGCTRNFTVVKTTPQAMLTDEITRSDNNDLFQDGLILYRQGDLVHAESKFSQFLQNEPNDWLALYYLGHCRSSAKDCIAALKHYHKSLNFAPNDKRSRAMIYLAVGVCQEETNETAKARQSYHMALKLNPELTEARNGLERLSPLSESSPN